MRVVFFTVVMVVCSVLTVFTQSPSSVLPHNEFMKFKMGKPGISNFSDTLYIGKLNVPFSTKNLNFNDSKYKELKMGKPPKGNYTTQRGMPIYKSLESFPMPVYKPDSTIKFFMQIKEYKKFPSNGIR